MSDKPRRKTRLDLLLVEKGLAQSRQKAEALILAGRVTSRGKIVSKPGTLLDPEAVVEITELFPYVGRGGVKLEEALRVLDIEVSRKVCLDVGSSTGGFTDCLLQRGAAKVYAVDVGRGQLAWKLREDPRVVCLERVNARTLSAREIPEPVDFVTVDVSFISARKILPAVRILMNPEGEIVLLFKPQFEAGPQASRKGVVRNPETHRRALEDFLSWCAEEQFYVLGATPSPITGRDGNIEFFFRLGFVPPGAPQDIQDLVEKAHVRLTRSLPG